jgi:hypothetical protein
MRPDELLERMSGTLRRDIGPAVGDGFAKTQAFMASVILEKLARQLNGAAARAELDRGDALALGRDLRERLGSSPAPSPLEAALAAVSAGDDAALGPLVDALYQAGPELGEACFADLLARVRRTLRARLDRQLEYSS